MNFIGREGGFPPSIVIMAVGMIPYFSIFLLSERLSLKQLIMDGIVFFLLGVTLGGNFANGHAAFRILFGHPARPLFLEGIAMTYFVWLSLWLSAVLCMVSIYLLGRKKYLAGMRG